MMDAGWAIEQSPLVKVAGVGQAIRHSGITVELLALEIRETGVIAHLRMAIDMSESARDPRKGAFPMPHALVTDSRGNRYGVTPRGGNGNEGSFSTSFGFVPPPPPEIEWLEVDIDHIGEIHAAPWRFRIDWD